MTADGFLRRWPALQAPSFRYLVFVRVAMTLALQSQSLGVMWQIYDITHDPLAVGLIGFFQVIPVVMMAPFAGEIADRFRRETVIALALAVLACCTLALLALTLGGARAAWPFYTVMLVVGFARALTNPSLQALMPNLVAREHIGNAVALNSMGSRSAQTLGPIVAGALLAVNAELVHVTNLLAFVAAALAAVQIVRTNRVEQLRSTGRVSLKSLLAGFRYMAANRALLGAITLDVAAVLFSGVNALLPFFAEEVLHVGTTGLGFLRGAQAVGGMIAAVYLGAHSLRTPIGPTMFAAIGTYGSMMIVFALSTSIWISLAALPSSASPTWSASTSAGR
jgi:MFS family permease